MGLLIVMKGLPLTYNRDLQEDKEGLFDTVDTLISCLAIFAEIIDTLKVNSDKMRNAINSYTLATDLADYLTKKDVSFREAHGITGNLVKYALSKGKSFKEMSLKEYQKFSPLFDDDVYNITAESSIDSRNVIGGTAHRQVIIALARAKRIVKS
jgi:argininosuccinate lyase